MLSTSHTPPAKRELSLGYGFEPTTSELGGSDIEPSFEMSESQKVMRHAL